MKLSSSKSTSVLLLVVLVAALLFALYYYVVLPKKAEADQLESAVNNLQTEIDSIQNQIAEASQSENTSNEFMLRKKVPATRGINDLLLNIEEIEYITQSRILSINFNNYDDVVAESELAPTPEEEGSEETTTETEQPTEEETAEEEPTSSIAIETLPTSLKMITFEISVESPNNARLQTFIKELEGLDRIMHVDAIEYSLPGEEVEFGESEVIEATIQVTTFFYE